MKPWLVWLLDPRPPWWRSTRVWLPMFGLLVIAVPPSLNMRAWSMGRAVWQGCEKRDGSFALHSRDDPGAAVNWLVVSRTYLKEEILGYKRVTVWHQAFIPDGLPPPWYHDSMSLEDLFRVKPASKDVILSTMGTPPLSFSVSEYTQASPEMSRLIDQVELIGGGGTFVEQKPAAQLLFALKPVLRRGPISIVCIIVLVAVGRRWFEGMVIRRRERLSANTCPSCEYPEPGSTCPECGIDVNHEHALVEALYHHGYRGLKALAS